MTELIIDTGADRVRVQNDYLIRQFLSMAKNGGGNDIEITEDYIEIVSGFARDGGIIKRGATPNDDPIKIPIHETSMYITMVLEGDDFDVFGHLLPVHVQLTYSTMHKVNHTVEVPTAKVKTLCNKLKELGDETKIIFGDKLVSAYAQYKTKIEVKRGN